MTEKRRKVTKEFKETAVQLSFQEDNTTDQSENYKKYTYPRKKENKESKGRSAVGNS